MDFLNVVQQTLSHFLIYEYRLGMLSSMHVWVYNLAQNMVYYDYDTKDCLEGCWKPK
jgi:hypothetical protein